MDPDFMRRIATLERGGICFHYRVAGVAVDGDRVLLHRTEIDDFWSLPGGHVELGETAADALQREMMEEIGVEIEVGRLLWVVENFFDYGEARHHEIGLYFLMSLGAGSPLYHRPGFQGNEQGLRIELWWFPRQQEILSRLPVLPACLQQGLVNLPETTCHLVVRPQAFVEDQMEKIETLHPEPGKKGVNISRAKYDLMRETILAVIHERAEITFRELTEEAERRLADRFEGSIPWYVVTVKLDLEARGEIERVAGSAPQRLRLK